MRATVRELRITVPAVTSELGALRGHVRDRAVELGADRETAEEFELVVSELATNVIMHTSDDRITVSVGRREGSWSLDVGGADGLDRADFAVRPDSDSIDGRGLFIVNVLMDEVHIATDRSGRSVRCVKNFRS